MLVRHRCQIQQDLHILPTLKRSEPGTLECASSSTTQVAGRRERMASKSISSNTRAAIFNLFSRNQLQAFHLGHGVAPAVRLEIADDDLLPQALHLLGFFEHAVGLPTPAA